MDADTRLLSGYLRARGACYCGVSICSVYGLSMLGARGEAAHGTHRLTLAPGSEGCCRSTFHTYRPTARVGWHTIVYEYSMGVRSSVEKLDNKCCGVCTHACLVERGSPRWCCRLDYQAI